MVALIPMSQYSIVLCLCNILACMVWWFRTQVYLKLLGCTGVAAWALGRVDLAKCGHLLINVLHFGSCILACMAWWIRTQVCLKLLGCSGVAAWGALIWPYVGIC